MPFNFDLSGRKELQKRLMEQDLANAGLQNQLLQAKVDEVNPNTEAIRGILARRSQTTDPIEQKALEVSLSRYGTVDTAAGKMPVFATQDMADERQRNMFLGGAQRLADAERAIQEAEASGDIPLANSMRTMRDNMYKNAKDNFKKVPFDKLDELSNRRSFLDAAEKVASILQEEGSSSLYGPIDSFMGDLGGRTGIMTNDKYVKLSQAFAATRNALLKELAGSAVTEQEAARQLENIGNLGRADFGQKFMSFYNQARRDFYNKVQTLNDSGFQIPERLITRSEQGVTTKDAPAATGQPQQSGQSSFQYDPRARRLIPGR